MQIIAKIYTDFYEKFGIPRQSGLSGNVGRIVFEPPYRNPDALRGIEGYSHVWLIWQFSDIKRKEWSPTVRPPRLGGNRKMGVFSTRSPYRPNPIGLSSVRLLGIEKDEKYGDVLIVEGADMLNETPIYDIKPYLAFTDSHPDAVCGFAEDTSEYALSVDIPPQLAKCFDEEDLAELSSLLSQDPRPHYKKDGDAEYGMQFKDKNISFYVKNGIVNVTKVQDLQI